MSAHRIARSLVAASLVSFALAGVTATQAWGTVEDPPDELSVESTSTSAPTTTSGSHREDDIPVTLCHAHSSDKNPYRLITVDDDAVFRQGHDQHEHQGRTDIIPPFDYTDQDGIWQRYPGKGWDDTGQAIWRNGCETPTQTEMHYVRVEKQWKHLPHDVAGLTALVTVTAGDRSATFTFDDDGDLVASTNTVMVHGRAWFEFAADLEPVVTEAPLPEIPGCSWETPRIHIGGGDFAKATVKNEITCEEEPTEFLYYQPDKVWSVSGAALPTSAQAVVTLTGGDRSASFTFNSSGLLTAASGDLATYQSAQWLKVPEGTTVSVEETVSGLARDGYTFVHSKVIGAPTGADEERVIVVTNTVTYTPVELPYVPPAPYVPPVTYTPLASIRPAKVWTGSTVTGVSALVTVAVAGQQHTWTFDSAGTMTAKPLTADAAGYVTVPPDTAYVVTEQVQGADPTVVSIVPSLPTGSTPPSGGTATLTVTNVAIPVGVAGVTEEEPALIAPAPVAAEEIPVTGAAMLPLALLGLGLVLLGTGLVTRTRATC
jgi:hypothetical protein